MPFSPLLSKDLPAAHTPSKSVLHIEDLGEWGVLGSVFTDID